MMGKILKCLVLLSCFASPHYALQIPLLSAQETMRHGLLANEAVGPDALQALVQRRLPKHLHNAFEFILELEDSKLSPAYDSFRVSRTNASMIVVKSSTVSGLSRGLLTYLRSIGGDIYWSGDTFEAIDRGTSTFNAIQGESWAKWRYFMNVCTHSYTTAFYQWDKWEYLIDWMSLHGINMPLAITGQEYIWARVYADLGLSQQDILSYFSGPAFQAWFRMGNIHGSWDMSISQEWLDKQWELQLKIISRMNALGMTPVLPAFNGFVPHQLHSKIGGPEFLKASNWNDFEVAYTNNSAIDPTWSTWNLVQRRFLDKQLELYGNWTSHYYSIDLFNELQPSSFDLDYLRTNTRSVVDSLKQVDGTATWIMQSWLFVDNAADWTADRIDALLSGAAEDEMLVLDLFAETFPGWSQTDHFGGKKWIWCGLYDFGGCQGLYGNLEKYAQDLVSARDQASMLTGIGLTMEGLNQNELVFELTLDVPWVSTKIETSTWLRSFISTRYHLKQSPAASFVHSAWTLLAASAYNNTDATVHAVIKSPLELPPSPKGILDKPGHLGTRLHYDPADLIKVFDLLYKAAELDPKLKRREAFTYDFVDVTRQLLVNSGIPIYREMIESWQAGDRAGLRRYGKTLVELLWDVDALLATNKNFLLSTWIKDARSWSSNKSVQDFYEANARNQITIWGTENVQPWPLNRYASKQWHGVVGDFYARNWQLFYTYLLEHGPSDYEEAVWLQELSHFEKGWVRTTMDGDGQFSGQDPFAVASSLRQKWSNWLGRR